MVFFCFCEILFSLLLLFVTKCMIWRLYNVHGLYGMKHTVQEFLLHHDLFGVQIFHIMEKGLFIVQMIKSKANNVCMRGQDN